MLDIALIGVGVVGSCLFEQLTNNPQCRVVAIANSRQLVLSDNIVELDWNDAQPFALSTLTAHLQPFMPHAVVVDCTSNMAIAEQYPTWLQQGIHVITPNKKAFSSNYGHYASIMHSSRTFSPSGKAWVFFESTVGAGLPLINTVRDLRRTGDSILYMQGMLSGTLAYLFNVYCPLQKGEAVFSDVVKGARDSGYTEPDPRDDLNGMDVARKVVILARLAGKQIELDDVNVQNLLPTTLQGVEGVEAFMNQLESVDDHYNQLRQEAYRHGGVLRYVASMDLEKDVYTVALKVLPQHDPLAQSSSSDNVLRIVTQRFPNGLEIKGAGAGAQVTVFGVMCDVYRLLDIVS
jgi:homoserine dehydrogenase